MDVSFQKSNKYWRQPTLPCFKVMYVQFFPVLPHRRNCASTQDERLINSAGQKKTPLLLKSCPIMSVSSMSRWTFLSALWCCVFCRVFFSVLKITPKWNCMNSLWIILSDRVRTSGRKHSCCIFQMYFWHFWPPQAKCHIVALYLWGGRFLYSRYL